MVPKNRSPCSLRRKETPPLACAEPPYLAGRYRVYLYFITILSSTFNDTSPAAVSVYLSIISIRSLFLSLFNVLYYIYRVHTYDIIYISYEV